MLVGAIGLFFGSCSYCCWWWWGGLLFFFCAPQTDDFIDPELFIPPSNGTVPIFKGRFFFGPKPLTIPQIRSGKLAPQILIGSLGHSPLSYYHGRKFFLRNNMQKTYPSKTFPPQNDYELKKTTNRLEKIGGSCLDCANLILFGFPSARGLMGCFRKSRGRSTVVGQVDWAQHPKQGTNKKMTIQTHLSFSDTKMNWPTLSVHKLCMLPTTSRKGWMLCCSNRMDEKRERYLMSQTNIKNTLQPNRPPKHHLSRHISIESILDTVAHFSTRFLWVPLATIFSWGTIALLSFSYQQSHPPSTSQPRGLRGDVLRDGHRSGSLLSQGHQYGRCDLRRSQGAALAWSDGWCLVGLVSLNLKIWPSYPGLIEIPETRPGAYLFLFSGFCDRFYKKQTCLETIIDCWFSFCCTESSEALSSWEDYKVMLIRLPTLAWLSNWG